MFSQERADNNPTCEEKQLPVSPDSLLNKKNSKIKNWILEYYLVSH